MANSAPVTIHVPAALRAWCGCDADIALEAASVRDALAQIERESPSLHRAVVDETGAVRRHLNVFVNTSHMRDREGLDTPLAAGDVILILPAVSGG